VIAHSLGTVIASDHFWDLQRQRHPEGATTPLERGETLAYLYTLGCPIALWTLRYDDFGQPIAFPAPTLSQFHPGLHTEWVNFYDRDDLVAYPLKGLSKEYEATVTEDRAVNVGPLPISLTPVSHVCYWNDSSVMRPIAKTLATAAGQLSPSTQGG
jgi:hypothetical protein